MGKGVHKHVHCTSMVLYQYHIVYSTCIWHQQSSNWTLHRPHVTNVCTCSWHLHLKYCKVLYNTGHADNWQCWSIPYTVEGLSIWMATSCTAVTALHFPQLNLGSYPTTINSTLVCFTYSIVELHTGLSSQYTCSSCSHAFHYGLPQEPVLVLCNIFAVSQLWDQLITHELHAAC